jgi:hypothetical protein
MRVLLFRWRDFSGIQPGAVFKYQAFSIPSPRLTRAPSRRADRSSTLRQPHAAERLSRWSRVRQRNDWDIQRRVPLSDIRLGERFVADACHALAGNGHLDDTVLLVPSTGGVDSTITSRLPR